MSSQDIQYVAKRDAAGTWRILDTWDESLSSIADDEEISENESLGEQLLDTDTVQDMASPRSTIQQPTPSSDLSESFLIKQMIIAKLANMGQAENMIGLND